MFSYPLHPPVQGSLLKFRSIAIAGLLATALTSISAQSTAPQYLFTHLAGPLGGPGMAEGIGPAARFNTPDGVAIDNAGNIYVADSANHAIRKVSPTGAVTTWAGLTGVAGSTDGAATAARFSNPLGVALDNAGNLYVADSGNATIRKITPSGIVSTLAGTAGFQGSTDGVGAAALFWYPRAVAVDSVGNVHVADNSTIRKITPTGLVTTPAGKPGPWGSVDGTGPDAQFTRPGGIAVDNAGNVYVADTGNNKLRKITPGGVVTSLTDPMGYTLMVSGAHGIALDSAGNLYVVASNLYTVLRISPAGAVITLAGPADYSAGSADGTGPAARFFLPGGLALDSAGNLILADSGNHTIRRITPAGVATTLAGTAGQYPDSFGTGIDGTGPAARFGYPEDVAVDSTGNVYVADYWNNAIRKITPAGEVTTLAGGPGYYNGGSTDGTGRAARFLWPRGIAADTAGTLYVADSGNNTIRKISPAGVVTTLAGAPTYFVSSTDGTGPDARFYNPSGVAVDSMGNVYVTEPSMGTIRKITPGGVVTTLAGTPGVRGYQDGTGAAAQFNVPQDLVADSAGNLYVLDSGNHVIRKVAPDGVVTTLSGKANIAGSEDGISADARFNNPGGIAFDAAGNLYVSDSDNHAIRKGIPAGPPVITTQPASKTVAPGDSVQFAVTASSVLPLTYQWFLNGSSFSGATLTTLSFTNARTSDAGDYTVVVTNQLGSVISSKATLTVAATPVTPATPPATDSGGGSIGAWFILSLLGLGVARSVHLQGR